tara:strand:- start:29 stop:772 length:744 start_codon:yes stop_codon:yes gene_type:complete
MKNKREIFVALGCSFTWGQGLYYYDIAKNSDMSQDEIKEFLMREDFLNSHHQWHKIKFKLTDGDWDSIKSLRSSDLVSKKLNIDYIMYNGDNQNNIKHIYEIYKDLKNDLLLNRKIKFVILQLTHPGRDAKRPKHYTIKHIKNTISKIDELYNFLKERDIELLAWCMTEDLGYSLKDKPYFLKIKVDGNNYNSFNAIVEDNKPQFELRGDPDLINYGVTDEHPSKHFHKLICDTILDKLEMKYEKSI